DGPDGKAPHIPPASSGEFLQIKRKKFSADAPRFFRRDTECEDCAINLGARCLDGLASLKSHGASELLATLGDLCGDVAQNTLPCECRHFFRHLKCAHARLD